MAESTEMRGQTVPQAVEPSAATPLAAAGAKFKLVLLRSVFWAYERGTWQYDLILVVILCFIFLTPISWFRHQPSPRLSDFAKSEGVIEIGRIQGEWSYFVNSRLVQLLPHLKIEDATREILHRRYQKDFVVKSVDVIRDKNDRVVGYRVVVEQ